MPEHQTSSTASADFSYYFRRLLPFFAVFIGYEALEVGVLSFVNRSEMDWSASSVIGVAANLIAESMASFLFLIVPYLLYLLALPAPFHGGKTDRRVTLVLFLLFCLVNAVEETLEIVGNDRFSLYTLQFLQSPGETWRAFVACAPAGTMAAAISGTLIATFLILRKQLNAELPSPPHPMIRAGAAVFALALAFLFSFGSTEMMHASPDNRELAREGIFTFFGDLFAVTPMPNLHTIFLKPAFAAAAVFLCLLLLRPCRSFLSERVQRAFSSSQEGTLRARLRLPSRFGLWLGVFLAAILTVRLFSLAAYPLMDATEARYAEIARKMIETGNWLTPQIDYGVPFWGKPPLSFWASAATMSAAGVGAFGARLAPFLASVMTGLLFFAWPFPADKRQKALACWIITAISGIGFVASGAVMTDQFLAFGLMLAMVAFRRALEAPPVSPLWGYLVFVGMAVGLLAKGPLALVLTGFPLFLWLLWSRRGSEAWRRIPWLRGVLLLSLLGVPWYWMAERATPGFLNYFLVGEHFHRFIDKGWQGDMYGTGHARTVGTIWIYGLAMFLPWSLLLPFLFLKKAGSKASLPFADTPYLVCWAASPLLFFTLARNILPAYVLPSIPPLAILTVQRLWLMDQRFPGLRRLIFLPASALAAMAGFIWGGGFERLEYRCQRDLLKHWDGVSPLYYADEERVPYSAQFYSQGRARLLPTAETEAACTGKTFVAVSLADYRRQREKWEGWIVEGSARERILLSRMEKKTHLERTPSPAT